MTNEANSRPGAQTTRLQQEYDRRLLHYERDFDINLSRIASKDKTLRQSMLAYSERVRSITNARIVSESSKPGEGEHLVIRAKHIPKHRELPKKRRPLSLDELIGVNNKQVNKAKKKPKSASRLSLPSLPDRLTKNHHNVQVSFVSASDLYDIVDYSLKHKGMKHNNLLTHQHNIKNNRDIDAEHKKRPPADMTDMPTERQSERTKPKSLPPLEMKDLLTVRKNDGVVNEKIQKEKMSKSDELEDTNDKVVNKTATPVNEQLLKDRTFPKRDYSTKIEYVQIERSTDTQQVKSDALKRRPNRAKRMKLHEPDLVVIPEGDVLNYQSKKRIKDKAEKMKNANSSMVVRRSLGKVAAKPDLEIILESEAPSPIKNDLLDSDSEGSDTGNSVDENDTLTSRNSPPVQGNAVIGSETNLLSDRDNSSRNSPHKKTRAQKRFKKLIFLRDVPEWYYQRI